MSLRLASIQQSAAAFLAAVAFTAVLVVASAPVVPIA